jgi:hypothetical protein
VQVLDNAARTLGVEALIFGYQEVTNDHKVDILGWEQNGAYYLSKQLENPNTKILSISMSSDGTYFGKNNDCWPVYMCLGCLPAKERYKFANMVVVAIVPNVKFSEVDYHTLRPGLSLHDQKVLHAMRRRHVLQHTQSIVIDSVQRHVKGFVMKLGGIDTKLIVYVAGVNGDLMEKLASTNTHLKHCFQCKDCSVGLDDNTTEFETEGHGGDRESEDESELALLGLFESMDVNTSEGDGTGAAAAQSMA